MRGDDDILALLDEGKDFLVVVGPDSFCGELETLTSGGRDVVASAPDVHLFLAPLFARVVLVQAAQLAIVALVECLVLVDRDGFLADLLELNVERGLRALQRRGKGDVELDPRRTDAFGPGQRFLTSELGQLRVFPTSEQVELVPFGLAVAREHERTNHDCSVSGKDTENSNGGCEW